MLQTLLEWIERRRKTDPDLIVTLKSFEESCRQAGFKDSGEALEALRAEGSVRSYRIQSGRIKLFLRARP